MDFASLLTDLLHAVNPWAGPMNRADRALWRQARTLPDLCDLMTRWVTGRIKSQPGMYGKARFIPEVRDALASLGHAHFLVVDAQEGSAPANEHDVDGDGWAWYSCAAVQVFASGYAARRLVELLEAAGYTDFDYVMHDCKRTRWRRGRPGITVTWREDPALGDRYDVTRYGRQLGRTVIAGEMFDGCHTDAIGEVCDAVQLTIVDNEPGRNDLWLHLIDAADKMWCVDCWEIVCEACSACGNGRCECRPGVTSRIEGADERHPVRLHRPGGKASMTRQVVGVLRRTHPNVKLHLFDAKARPGEWLGNEWPAGGDVR